MARRIANVPKTLWALLFFITLSVGTTYPLIIHLGDHLRDDGDSYEFAWAIGFGAYQLTHDPLHLFSGNIFYPFPLSLAYSESTVPDLALGTPIVLLSGNPVLALNILILVTFVAGAFGMYLLVVERTNSPGAGIVSGIMYGFSPYLFDHLAQLPIMSIEWAPYALWACDRYVATGKNRWAASFAMFGVLQVLVSFYYAFILGIGIAMYAVIRLVITDRDRLRLRWLMPLVGFGVLGSVIVVPFVSPYFELERTFGLRRTLDEAIFFSAWPANYLAPSHTIRFVLIDPVLRFFGRQAASFGDSERDLYPGLLIVALALVGIDRSRYQRAIAPAMMIFAGLVLGFGPLFHPSKGIAWDLPFTMPYGLLYEALPGFAALRVPSRFAALVVFGLAILAGDGLAHVYYRVRSLPRNTSGGGQWQAALLILTVGVAVLESVNDIPLVAVRSGEGVPAVYSWLASRAIPSATVELPIDDNAYHQSPRSYYSTYHHQPLVNGFRSFTPPGYLELAKTISGFPLPRSIATLQRLGVRYVIVHEAEMPRPIIVPPRTPGITPTAKFGTDVVYQVDGKASPEKLQILSSAPGCLTPGSADQLSVTLRSGDGFPMIVFSPGTYDATFRLDWHGQLGSEYHEDVAVPIPAVVMPFPVQFNLPYHSPAREDVYRLSVSLVDQPGLRGSSALSMVAVGKTAASSRLGVSPRLLDAQILSARTSASDGLPYSLTWQTNGNAYESLRVFVNAYDTRRDYWSFPSTTPETFDSPPGCPGGLVRDVDQLPLRPDTPPGQYWVEAGVLDAKSGKRIPFVDPSGNEVERIEIGAFWIRPKNVLPGEFVEPPDSAGQYEFGQLLVLEQWISDSEGVPNGPLHVRLRWRAEAPMPVDYTFFLHLSDASGHIAAQYDGQPSHGVYPTSAWVTDDTLIEDYELQLPPSIQPGRYRLTAGVYDLQTLKRLSLQSEHEGNSDEANLGAVTIAPPMD